MGSIRGLLRGGRGGNSAHEELRSQSSRADGLLEEFESSGKGWFWETDPRGQAVLHQRERRRALGREPADLLERPFTDLISSETADGSATSERTLGFYLSSHVAFQDLIVRAKTKNETWWSISGRPVHDEIGRFFGFRGFASDLTKMRQSEVELDRLARQDALTGLANRAGASPGARRCVGERGPAQAPLLDVPARSRPLQGGQRYARPSGRGHIAAAGRPAPERRDRRAGQVGRLGGDEFEVVLPSTSDKTELSKLAQGIIDSLSRPYTINGTAVSIGASIGIVTSDYDDRTSDDLMRDADLALYAAKAAGKGCFRFFAPEMHEAARAAAADGIGSSRRTREGPAATSLSALRRCFERSGHRVRGADPLGPPRAWAGQPGRVHPARRGNRPDQRDRRMGASHRLRRSGQVARHDHGRGESVAGPVQIARSADDRPDGLSETRLSGQAARAGDHRGRVPQQRRPCPRHDRAASRRSG